MRRWRDVTLYELRAEAILVRYRDQKERAPRISALVARGNYCYAGTHQVREKIQGQVWPIVKGLFVCEREKNRK